MIKKGDFVRLVDDAEEICVGQGFGWHPDIMGDLVGKDLKVVAVPQAAMPNALVVVSLFEENFQVPLQVLTKFADGAVMPTAGALVRMKKPPEELVRQTRKGPFEGVCEVVQAYADGFVVVRALDRLPDGCSVMVPQERIELLDCCSVRVRFDYFSADGRFDSCDDCVMIGVPVRRDGQIDGRIVADKAWRLKNEGGLPGIGRWNGFVLVTPIKPEGSPRLLIVGMATP